MNNLFRSKTKVYVKKFSEREMYERDCFYYLKVEDQTGIIEQLGGDDFMQELFKLLQTSSIESVIYKSIDYNFYDTVVQIIRKGNRDVIAKVTITRRYIPLKFEERLKKIKSFLSSL